MASSWPCSKLSRARHASQIPSHTCPVTTAHRRHSVDWLGLGAEDRLRIPRELHTREAATDCLRGSDGLSLCRLPCFGSGTFVGFSRESRSRAWGTGSVCVWRLAGPEETLHWKLQQSIDGGDLKVYGKTKIKGENLVHTFQNKESWPCILHYTFETRIFKSHAHIIKGSTSACIKF